MIYDKIKHNKKNNIVLNYISVSCISVKSFLQSLLMSIAPYKMTDTFVVARSLSLKKEQDEKN